MFEKYQINAGVSVETLIRAYDHTQSSDYIMELTKHDYTGFDEVILESK